jgi:hypothetical protein
VDAWLSANTDLAIDLRQKVLQARDDLERTVRVRERYAGAAAPTGVDPNSHW